MTPWDSIKTRRAEVPRSSANEGSPASVKLGGTTLWAADSGVLQRGIQSLEAAVLEAAGGQLTTTRNVLKKLVQDELGAPDLDDKLFSAVLGAALRSGRMDAVAVVSKNDKAFRVFIHRQQLDRWQRAQETALTLLKSGQTLTVRDLESRLFKHRAYNTWSSTSHVLGYLSYFGTVRLLEDGSGRLEELE